MTETHAQWHKHTVFTVKSIFFFEKKIKDYNLNVFGLHDLTNNTFCHIFFPWQFVNSLFLLPHMVCSEAYVRAFQYKVLNFILYTNTKLHKIGYITDDKCSFCKSEPETLLHLLFNCVYSRLFWKDFEFYFTLCQNNLFILACRMYQ